MNKKVRGGKNIFCFCFCFLFVFVFVFVMFHFVSFLKKKKKPMNISSTMQKHHSLSNIKSHLNPQKPRHFNTLVLEALTKVTTGDVFSNNKDARLMFT